MRIAIVNDLVVAQESLRRIVESVPGHEIAWVAENGEEAVQKNAESTPDLILMDLMMPVMDGVQATRRIMTDPEPNRPCPILVVTATVGANSAKVFEAMGYGALDAVTIPMMGKGAEAEKSRYILLRKIHNIAKLRGIPTHHTRMKSADIYTGEAPPLVLIGSSTGGPKALARVLSDLPEDLGAAVVIIQHVDEKFSPGLAEWLNEQTPLRVRLADEGAAPEINTVYVAGTNDHLIFTRAVTFSYTPEPGNISYRPSVDVFFQSAVENYQEKAGLGGYAKPGIGVILTGMGKDGALGLRAMRDSGWHTIAQDKETSVVYGMPKAAMDIGAALDILPIEKIGTTILEKLAKP